nr:MAG TPA: tail connector protein [Caudoviricetes sp.]
MAEEQKLDMLANVLGITLDATTEDVLTAYLALAKSEIIAWRYSLSPSYSEITEIPKEYETVQIFAVVAGYSQRGAENQTGHSENGISRTFSHADMVQYIHANVRPICGVI